MGRQLFDYQRQLGQLGVIGIDQNGYFLVLFKVLQCNSSFLVATHGRIPAFILYRSIRITAEITTLVFASNILWNQNNLHH
jgi:hypothetical protein